MIKKIVLENFLSYADVSVELSGSTIAVVGDNGVGKSAFLEAIPYAYFGIGRETKEGMSRLNGDGSHRVDIWDDDTVVSRGRKANGTGFTEVRSHAGNILAKGKDADDWIVNRLGMTGDTFMLTAFFGLGDSYSDTLLRVCPSARLESLQDLAQVGPYREFLSKAKLAYSVQEKVCTQEQSRKEAMESVFIFADGLLSKIKECEDTVSVSELEMDRLRKKRAEYQSEESAYQAFVLERERLLVERRGMKSKIDQLEADVEAYSAQIETDTEYVNTSHEKVSRLSEDLDRIDVPSVILHMDALTKRRITMQATMKLKSTAMSLDGETTCPLCDQVVTDKIIQSWSEAVVNLQVNIQRVIVESAELQTQVDTAAKWKKSLDDLFSETSDVVEAIATARSQRSFRERDVLTYSGELIRMDDRFHILSDKLGEEYQGLQARIRQVLSEFDTHQSVKQTALGEITQLKEAVKRNDAAKKAHAEAVKAMSAATAQMSALNLLKNAWSRYGIPLQLVHDLMQRIEDRASSVYQGFDNGQVSVCEVDDRGKPGVQFYLVDRKGKRTFSQLSMGEKVMFFISIRVAIAQIVAEDSPITVDFLVLDEVLGNLSPKRRDDLVRLINKTLRKVFPQLILVTHTTMPDIFDKIIEVSMRNDVSSVAVF